MAKMAEQCKGNVLIIAHRKELLRQHEELFNQFNISARFSSVFTEARHRNPIAPMVIFIDECHLSEAQSYKDVVAMYPGAYVIGFTATPQRLSGERLSIFDCLIQGISVKELQERKAIAEFDYYAPDIAMDLDSITIRMGDYALGELEEAMCQSRLYGDYLKAWETYSGGRQTIAYAVSIRNAEQIAKAFNDNGVPSIAINGKQGVIERLQAINEFKQGKYKVLVNVGLISEGITLPECDCGLLLRPTQSLALFIQQSMRCLTYNGNKKVIIDCVGNYQRHGLPNDDREWSLDGKTAFKRTNSNGTFTIRQCPECFRVYDAKNDKCPYCGVGYKLKPRELKNIKDIEMVKVKQEQAQRMIEQRKELKKEQGKARSYQELVKIGIERGYKNPSGWAYMVLRGRNK